MLSSLLQFFVNNNPTLDPDTLTHSVLVWNVKVNLVVGADVANVELTRPLLEGVALIIHKSDGTHKASAPIGLERFDVTAAALATSSRQRSDGNDDECKYFLHIVTIYSIFCHFLSRLKIACFLRAIIVNCRHRKSTNFQHKIQKNSSDFSLKNSC